MRFERKEYPRPQFRRDDWQPLNGEWEFAFDDQEDGEIRGIPSGKVALDKKILVPYCYQYAASGIGDKSVHETVWYRRTFTLEKRDGKRPLLCFNGSDYITDVWVNGQHVCSHTGAYAPFKADVAKYAVEGENVIVVRCYDPLDAGIPRGKQSWTGGQFSCWYYPSTGIWQSVWIEFFEEDCIDGYSLFTNVDTGCVYGEIQTMYGKADELEISVTFQGDLVAKQRVSLRGKKGGYDVCLLNRNALDKLMFWSPEIPCLYYADLTLYKGGKALDKAHTRFGMRKVYVNEHGKIYLNDAPYYQRLILDQGYWKESGTTPPSVEALKKDIELCKAMGFNGARKHQKTEDPYWYYLAEEIGFLTWCEMPSAYDFCESEVNAIVNEWQEIVSVAKNFTSVIAYVPLNESWGVSQVQTDKKQQDLARSLYYITYAIDGTRLVSTNDGWQNVTPTDMISVHDYAYDDSEFKKKYVEGDWNELNAVGKKAIADGCSYEGQPVLLSEFGGVAMTRDSGGGNWGYGEGAKDAEAFYKRIDTLVKGVYNCPFQGYCYTQVSDVQQEVNGLLDENHEPKFDVERLKKIFTQKP